MRAIILAAGMGNRLQDASNQQPKCLLMLGEKTLLQRHLENLAANGIKNITLVCGYKIEAIKNYLESLETQDMEISVIENKRYDEGSVISFYCSANEKPGDDDIILMDADVLYSHDILQRLITSTQTNVFLLDRDFEAGDEPVKLCVRQEEIIEFRKQIDKNLDYDFQGESVGFFKFTAIIFQRLLNIAKNKIEQGQNELPYEEIIRELLLQEPKHFQFEDITGLPWIEIDFPEDIQRANNDILPKL